LTAEKPLPQPDERSEGAIAHSLRAAHHRGLPAILCFTASVRRFYSFMFDQNRASLVLCGILGIGLPLFCLRGLSNRGALSDKLLALTFQSLNSGLAMMVFMSLVPAGVYQAWASISDGCMVCTFAGFRTFVVDGNLRLLARPGSGESSRARVGGPCPAFPSALHQSARSETTRSCQTPRATREDASSR
jgi:hypothetical protein